MNELEKRIIDISYERKLTHISSCLSAVNLIDNLYGIMRPKDRFILSQGHAFLALAVVLEKRFGLDAKKLSEEHGTHPNRKEKEGIWASTGSLGQGIAIGVGMALADRTRNVYIVASDGEMAEGMAWEALRVAGEQRLENLRINVVANGYGGYGKIDTTILDTRLQMFYPTLIVRTNMFAYPDFMQGIQGHYVVLDMAEYKEISK